MKSLEGMIEEANDISDFFCSYISLHGATAYDRRA
jgi:hypothetical protein